MESIKGISKMNANELVDAMDTHGFRYHHVKAAVKMLREQAETIKELQLILAQQEIHVECYRNQLRKANEK
jgi:thermostable 8-oxoguanine DNA glycosylase